MVFSGESDIGWSRRGPQEFLPYRGSEEYQYGEKLQAACQHIEDQYDLAEIREKCEILTGSHHLETGTYIVDGGGYCGEIGHHIVALKADGQKRHGEYEYICHEKYIYIPHNLMLHRLFIHSELLDAFGVDVSADLLVECLGGDDETAYLDAASGTSGAGADEHQHHKHCLAVHAPVVEIIRGESRGGDDGSHLEEGVLKGSGEAVVDVDGVGHYDDDGGENDGEIHPHLLHLQGFAELMKHYQIVGVEVDAEEYHEDCYDPLACGIVACDGIV